jgi:hypothetical protein
MSSTRIYPEEVSPNSLSYTGVETIHRRPTCTVSYVIKINRIIQEENMYSDKLKIRLLGVLKLAAFLPRIFLLSVKMCTNFFQTNVLLQSKKKYSKWSNVVQIPKTSVNCRVNS